MSLSAYSLAILLNIVDELSTYKKMNYIFFKKDDGIIIGKN